MADEQYREDVQADTRHDRLADVEDSLYEEIHTDARIQSGVSGSGRADDLNFIQMTGLTRPAPDEDASAASEPERDLDPTGPLDFYERGVTDVDAAAGERNTEESLFTRPDDDEIPSAFVSNLQNIIDELTLEEAHPRKETPLVDSQDFNEAPATFDGIAADVREENDDQASTFPGRITEDGLREHVAGAAPGASSLEEAQAYVRELQEAPSHPAEAEVDVVQSSSESEPLPEEDAGTPEAHDEPAITEPLPARRSRRNRKRRRLLRWGFRGLVLIGLAAAGYAGWRWFDRAMVTPESVYYEANKAAERGNQVRAARLYASFADNHPRHALAGEALFKAALERIEAANVATEHHQAAHLQAGLQLFERFIAAYPNHSNTPRAQSLLGVTHFRLGHYEQAINLLRDPELRVSDPLAALPAMRVLARSYGALGDLESARSHFLQAASLPGNVSRDQDYKAVGDLYYEAAQQAEGAEPTQSLQEVALNFWEQALRTPTIDPVVAERLKMKRDLLLNGMSAAGSEFMANLNSTGLAQQFITPDIGEERLPPSAEAHDPVSAAANIDSGDSD